MYGYAQIATQNLTKLKMAITTIKNINNDN